MKNRVIIFILLLLPNVLFAQTMTNYSLKGQYVFGEILKHNKHLENLVQEPVKGFDVAVEWQTTGEHNWHQFFNFPRIGLGFSALDLGNPEMLGQLAAVYPYFIFPVFDFQFVKLNLKTGAGLSFLNKRYSNSHTDSLGNILPLNSSNAAIGSIINVYFAAGANVEIPVTGGLSLVGEYNWNHASNGSFFQPNSGINMYNKSLGIRVTPQYHRAIRPFRKYTRPIPRKWSLELTASGGTRELYYLDEQRFSTASAVVGLFYPISNTMRLGVAVDGFYDGVFGAVNSSTVTAENTSKYKRTYVATDDEKNKYRVGVSLQPEFMFGRLIIGFHGGVYVYNPIKNLEPYLDAKAGALNKPLVYMYDIEKEDGWFYTRASMKYMLSSHFYLALGLKTHLQKAEFIEWGMGVKF